MKRGNRPRVGLITSSNQVKRVIRDDATKLLFGEIIPLDPVPSRRVSEKLSFEQGVTFGPVWKDEERAFTGGETEFIGRASVLVVSSQRRPISRLSHCGLRLLWKHGSPIRWLDRPKCRH